MPFDHNKYPGVHIMTTFTCFFRLHERRLREAGLVFFFPIDGRFRKGKTLALNFTSPRCTILNGGKRSPINNTCQPLNDAAEGFLSNGRKMFRTWKNKYAGRKKGKRTE